MWETTNKMDKLKGIIGGGGSSGGGSGEGDSSSLMEDMDAMCKCSYKTRLIGFCACCALGLVISFFSMFAILKPVTFGVLYTLGNIISLASTGFLVGPMKQIKQMFAEKRIIATIVFLSALVLTLVVAIWGGKKFIPLIIVLIVFQFFALVWYSASYIPFARSAIKTCVTSCLSK